MTRQQARRRSDPDYASPRALAIGTLLVVLAIVVLAAAQGLIGGLR